MTLPSSSRTEDPPAQRTGCHHCWEGTRNSGPRQVQPDSAYLSGVLMKATVPRCLDATPIQQWDSSPGRFQGSDSIPSQGRSEGIKYTSLFVPFLLFTLMPMLLSYSQFAFCLCLQCTVGLVMTHTYSIFGHLKKFFITKGIKQGGVNSLY